MNNNQSPRVCAVVVTFNRKVLLQRTLNALNKQTRMLDGVVLIDNASTDGTDELLQEQGYLQQENLQYILLDENTGGAGGFYQGVKLAFEQGYDWLWLMDDDGYPTETCLESLLQYKDEFDFFGPLVLDEHKTGKLSFPLRVSKSKILRSVEDVTNYVCDDKLQDVLAPFNGVMIKSNLIQKIGFPKAEFFIWGDEINYWLRANQENAHIATLTHIKFYHPTAPNLGTPMFFGNMQFNDTDSKIKLYCLCRNNTYNLRKFNSKTHALLFFFKVLWFYSVTKPSMSKLRFCLPPLWHGWKGDFSHHRQYIGQNFNFW